MLAVFVQLDDLLERDALHVDQQYAAAKEDGVLYFLTELSDHDGSYVEERYVTLFGLLL